MFKMFIFIERILDMKKSVRLISLILSVIILASSVAAPFSSYAQTAVKGVDISEHNGDVDFASLKSQGYSFVMIRLGYSDKYIDKYFYQNIQKAYDTGMNFGVYLYSYAFNTAEAQAEADFVISTLAALDAKYKENMILPIGYDLEDGSITDKSKGNCTSAEITQNALTFSAAVKAAGYDVMVYASDNWFKNYIDVNAINSNGIKIWYANWTDTESSNLTNVVGTDVPCYMWQYMSGSSKSSTNGLDLNILYVNSVAFMNISLSFTSAVYDGYAKAPAVYVYSSARQLINGVDYTVAYSNNINAGTAAVTVTGIGEFNGSVTKTFKINPITLTSSNVKVKLSASKYAYDGKTKKPTVKVYDSYGNVIPSSSYSLSYTGNANPGRKKVTVKFKGNYTGSVTAYYNIIPKKQTVSSVKSSAKKKLTVKWKKDSLVSGYQIRYSTSSKFYKSKTKTVTVSKKNTSKTLSKLTSGKKYYVQVRAYKTINGKKVYGSWSAAKSVKVK